MSKLYMARIAIISPNPVSRVWRERCGRRSRLTRKPPAKCLPQKVGSAADFTHRRRVEMPVYTVHAPVADTIDLRATDRFTFVRDGFHVWAALFGVVWLAWHRLWLALIGWIALMIVVDVV